MKEFLKGFILATILVIVVSIVPLTLFNGLVGYQGNIGTIGIGETSTYLGKMTALINSENLTTEEKGYVSEMFQIMADTMIQIKQKSYMLILYLELLVYLGFIILGIALHKKEKVAPFVSKALLAAGIISLLVLLVTTGITYAVM